jgi:amidase
VVKLAPGFDTIGWFARNAAMMRQIGEVLLPRAKTFVPTRLLIAIDAFTATGPEITCGLLDWIASHFD